MKKLLLTLAAAFTFVTAFAADPQNNLYLELQKNQVYCHGLGITLDEMKALVYGNVCYNNVIVYTDTGSMAYMMFAIREAVESSAAPQLLFVTLQDPESPTLIQGALPACTYLGTSFAYEPMDADEFRREDYGNPSVLTMLLDGKKIYTEGYVSNIVDAVEKLKAQVVGTEETANLRIKLTQETTIGEMLEFDSNITNEMEVRGVKANYSYFSGPSRLVSPIAFDIVKADLADIEIPEVDIAETRLYRSLPEFMGSSDLQVFGKYVESIYDYDIEKYLGAQGRVWVDFTVCVDGTVKDVVAVHGIEEVRECAVEGVLKAPSVWVPARDAGGNPVNMRVHKVMIKILAHL